MKLQMLLLISLATVLIPFSFAQAESSRWEQLQQHITLHGAKADSDWGLYMTLKNRVLLGTDGSYQVDYLSGVGGEDSNGVFHIGHLEDVSEVWRIDPNGNWDIEQWQYKVTVDGELQFFAHYHMIEKPNGIVLSQEGLPTSDPEFIHKWSELLEKWYLLEKISGVN